MFSPQQMLTSPEEIEALIEPFNGSVDSSTSMSMPAGNLAVTFFKGGEEAQQYYGALVTGNGQDKVSTIVLYLFAETPRALKGLVEEIGPRLEPTA